MSKFLPQKKKLVEEVYEKASSETTEKSFSGILKYLETVLFDEYKIRLSYKTLETYYQSIVEKDEDYNIKASILDELSFYLGYTNFKEYCAEWKTVEHTIKESPSKVVINVITKPLLKMPDFLAKQNGVSLIGLLMIGGLLIGKNGTVKKEDITEAPKVQETFGLLNTTVMQRDSIGHYPTDTKKEQAPTMRIVKTEKTILEPEDKLEYYMYWNGEQFIATTEANLGPDRPVIPLNTDKLKYLKKITRPDTITVESLHKVWYSKHNNSIEFFTDNGKNPENNKDLKRMTLYIFNKYIKEH